MSFNVQGAKGLTIPEGTVKTIHDKDNRLLWGAVGYNTKYAGDTLQQTYSGKNLVDYLGGNYYNQGTSATKGDDSVTFAKSSDGEYRYAVLKLSLAASQNLLGKTVSVSYTKALTISAVNSGYRVFWCANDSISVGSSIYNGLTTTSGEQTATFNIPSTLPDSSKPIVAILFYPDTSHAQSADSAAMTISDLQLEIGSTATAYEPYVGGVPSPNPGYPQDIQVVTGEQTVKVEGKNLLAYNLASLQAANFGSGHVWDGNKQTFNGITYTLNGDLSITVNGTASGGASWLRLGNDLDYLGNGIRYVLTGCPSGGDTSTYSMRLYDGSAYSREIGSGLTFDYIGQDYARINIANGASVNNLVFKPMIRLYTEQNSSYEPYQGQSYKVNLEGKNLWGGKEESYVSAQGFTATYNIDGTLSVTGAASSKNWSALTNAVYADGLMVELPAGTYTFTVWGGKETQLVSTALDGTGETANVTVNSGVGSVTFTTSSSRLFYPRIRVEAGATDYTVGFMIEAGSTATTYAPYFTPIELCKIGTYQDYIWKDGDTWKVHKEVGKVVLDGSETWASQTGSHTTVLNLYTSATNWKARPGENKELFCSIASYSAGAGSTNDTTVNICKTNYAASNFLLDLAQVDFADAQAFKTWLSSHNATVYYLLWANLADTAITDATLISQLNAIEEWMTRYGYVGTVFGSLPIVIDRTTI